MLIFTKMNLPKIEGSKVKVGLTFTIGLETQAISTISHGQSLLQPQLKPRYGWSNKVLSLQ